jgi:hypothetical protein
MPGRKLGWTKVKLPIKCSRNISQNYTVAKYTWNTWI